MLRKGPGTMDQETGTVCYLCTLRTQNKGVASLFCRRRCFKSSCEGDRHSINECMCSSPEATVALISFYITNAAAAIFSVGLNPNLRLSFWKGSSHKSNATFCSNYPEIHVSICPEHRFPVIVIWFLFKGLRDLKGVVLRISFDKLLIAALCESNMCL